MELRYTFRGFKQFFKRSGIALNELSDYMTKHFSFDTLTELWIAGRYSDKQLTEDEADAEIEEYLQTHSFEELNKYIMTSMTESGLFGDGKKKPQK